MIYLTCGSRPEVAREPHFGVMTTMGRSGITPIRLGAKWALDNGAFTGKFEPSKFVRSLERLAPYRGTCLFAVAPDVVQDASASLALWPQWSNIIRSYGYPAAYAAQNGQEHLPLPDFDVLFVGGSDTWKHSGACDAIIAEAKRRGKWVHIGRVNSQKRIRHFWLRGADSADGTAERFQGWEEVRRVLRPALLQGVLAW